MATQQPLAHVVTLENVLTRPRNLLCWQRFALFAIRNVRRVLNQGMPAHALIPAKTGLPAIPGMPEFYRVK
jgi:hypothetical protein